MTWMARLFGTITAYLLIQVSALAQDGGLLDIDIDIDKTEWYEQPWVWVVGALFLVLLAVIARGRK